MNPPLELQVLNLAEQLKVRHSLYLTLDESQFLLALVHGRPSWSRLVAADKNRTLPEDVPAQSQRLAQALKDLHEVSLTAHQAALILIAPAPLKLSKKGRSARFWKLNLNSEAEALWLLDLRCSGPVRSRPPVLFEKMTAGDIFDVDPEGRSWQPAKYLAALAKMGLDNDDKTTLQGFKRALRSASRLLERDDDFETAENLLVALSQIFCDRDDAPGDFDDWIEQNMFEAVQMELWMLERAFARNETVALEVHLPDEDNSKTRPFYKMLLPIFELPKGSEPVKIDPTDYRSTLSRRLGIDTKASGSSDLSLYSTGRRVLANPDNATVELRTLISTTLERCMQARGYRTAPVNALLAGDIPAFAIGFQVWRNNTPMVTLGVTNEILQQSLIAEPEEFLPEDPPRTGYPMMNMFDIERLSQDLTDATNEMVAELNGSESGNANA